MAGINFEIVKNTNMATAHKHADDLKHHLKQIRSEDTSICHGPL